MQGSNVSDFGNNIKIFRNNKNLLKNGIRKIQINSNKMSELKIVYEDFFHQVFESEYKGIPVRFFKNKFTGEIKISANDTAKCLGYDSLNELLSSDNGLDVISDWKKDNPDKPVFGGYDSGAMFEESKLNYKVTTQPSCYPRATNFSAKKGD